MSTRVRIVYEASKIFFPAHISLSRSLIINTINTHVQFGHIDNTAWSLKHLYGVGVDRWRLVRNTAQRTEAEASAIVDEGLL